MKRKILVFVLCLAMVLTLIPGMSLTASAEDTEELSEVITFDGQNHTASDHFRLAAKSVWSIGGWEIGMVNDYDSNILIKPKSDDIIITGIDAVVGALGSHYQSAVYSSGEKLETGSVEDNSIVHVRNINQNQLEISSSDGMATAFKDITVYYTYMKEVITFNQHVYAENDHFTLRTNGYGTMDGWFAGYEGIKLRINAKSDVIVITGIDAIVGASGENYPSIVYSSGEKSETGSVENNSIVHVRNINQSQLEISSLDGLNVSFKDITVYYKILSHTHEFDSTLRDNKDGTHSYKCNLCNNYCKRENHTFVNNKCVCGAMTPVPYTYYTVDGNTAVRYDDGICEDYEVFTTDTTSLEDGKWYVVIGNTTIDKHITVKGTAHLLICDGTMLTAINGIAVNENNTLNIYGQHQGTGRLNVDANDGFTAGIGGDSYMPCGTINIYGSNISTIGGDGGAGIGGGYYGAGGTVSIYGGNVEASGGFNGAGIGGGYESNGGNIAIYGGNVEAIGGYNGAGIGGGHKGNGGRIDIYGGEVEATGGFNGAGIGGGFEGNGGNVAIYDGNVTAIGCGNATGIGVGNSGENNGTLTVSDKMIIKGGKDKNNLAKIKKVNAEEYILIYPAQDTDLIEVTEGSAYALKDSDTATMRLMWKIEADEKAHIANIGAYVIPWADFSDITEDGRTKRVQYSNPTISDDQQIKSGNTFAVDIINIPSSQYDRTFYAIPFINSSFFTQQLIQATVNEADINR